VITTDANELVAEIHRRMPLILAPGDHIRWLSDELDLRELVGRFRLPHADVADFNAGEQAGERWRFTIGANCSGRSSCVDQTQPKLGYLPIAHPPTRRPAHLQPLRFII
jgi:hypothetical protein